MLTIREIRTLAPYKPKAWPWLGLPSLDFGPALLQQLRHSLGLIRLWPVIDHGRWWLIFG
jgi:hypothetical protein